MNCVAISRELFTHPVVGTHRKNGRYATGWAYLIGKASHKEYEVRMRHGSVHLERGQALTSIRSLARELSWTIQQVRSFLQMLSREGMISTETVRLRQDSAPDRALQNNTPPRSETTHRFTRITICNYNDFQPNNTSKQHIEKNKTTHITIKEDSSLRSESVTMSKSQKAKNPADQEFPWISEFDEVNQVKDQSQSATRPPASGEVEEAFEAFVQVAKDCDLSVPRRLTAKRFDALRLRLEEYSLADWLAVCDEIRNSKFLQGKSGSDRAWKVDFDTLTKPKREVFLKALEGKYRDQKPNQHRGQNPRGYVPPLPSQTPSATPEQNERAKKLYLENMRSTKRGRAMLALIEGNTDFPVDLPEKQGEAQ